MLCLHSVFPPGASRTLHRQRHHYHRPQMQALQHAHKCAIFSQQVWHEKWMKVHQSTSDPGSASHSVTSILLSTWFQMYCTPHIPPPKVGLPSWPCANWNLLLHQGQVNPRGPPDTGHDPRQKLWKSAKCQPHFILYWVPAANERLRKMKIILFQQVHNDNLIHFSQSIISFIWLLTLTGAVKANSF